MGKFEGFGQIIGYQKAHVCAVVNIDIKNPDVCRLNPTCSG